MGLKCRCVCTRPEAVCAGALGCCRGLRWSVGRLFYPGEALVSTLQARGCPPVVGACLIKERILTNCRGTNERRKANLDADGTSSSGKKRERRPTPIPCPIRAKNHNVCLISIPQNHALLLASRWLLWGVTTSPQAAVSGVRHWWSDHNCNAPYISGIRPG